jgi:hypothetical protein
MVIRKKDGIGRNVADGDSYAVMLGYKHSSFDATRLARHVFCKRTFPNGGFEFLMSGEYYMFLEF